MKKIIVVDDEPDVIYSIKEGLGTDFEITGVDSGKQLSIISKIRNFYP